MIMNKTITHYGIKGMRWGVRRFQNPDGSLTRRGIKRLEKRDERWVKSKGEKIKRKTQAKVQKDLDNFIKNELNPQFKTNGRLTAKTILTYNNKMAKLMNNEIGNIPTPSGRVLRFVAKRGNLGVLTAYADAGYDMSRVKTGVFSSGKVGYRDENLMKKGG